MPPAQFVKQSALQFEIMKQTGLTGGKKPIYFARCKICNSNLKNTALDRLQGHRRKCTEEQPNGGEVSAKTARERSRSPLRQRRIGEFVMSSSSSSSQSAAVPLASVQTDRSLTEEQLLAQEEMDVDNDLMDFCVDPVTGELIPTIPNPPPLPSVLLLTPVTPPASNRNGSSSTLTPNIIPSTSSMNTNASSSNASNTSSSIRTSSSSIRSSSSSLSTISPSCVDPSDSASCVSITPRVKKPKKKHACLDNYVDTITDEEVAEINKYLGRCFFGCNFAWDAVESVHFYNLIAKLRPAYAEKLPGRKQLSTTILDQIYEECLEDVKSTIEPESTLLIDGWKNSSNNSKLVVSMLHSANGNRAFVDAYDFTTESETGDNLVKVVEMSAEKVKELYNSEIFSVVSDNASNMLKMGRTIPQYHINCNAHTGNLLAKDLNDENFTKKVVSVLKEFKSHPGLEKKMVENGGKRIALPVDTRWCTYRDSYANLLHNWTPMRKVIAEEEISKMIKPDVKSKLVDDVFHEEVQDYIKIFDPVCKLINSSQKSDTSIAESTAQWLELKFEGGFEHLNTFVDQRRNMALNEYGLTAFYLHPVYHREKLHLLTEDHMKTITNFLVEELKEDYADVALFVQKKSIFTKLYKNNVSQVDAFWMAASSFHPRLSKLAMNLNSIPASSAQLERVFSQWSFVHNPLRNRLTLDKSKKLIHIYYSLKIVDRKKSNEY